jgi:hypothetical protein
MGVKSAGSFDGLLLKIVPSCISCEFILSNKQESEEDTNHNRKVFNRAREIQTSEWKEIWEIIQAQDAESYKNGSGMLSWWD